MSELITHNLQDFQKVMEAWSSKSKEEIAAALNRRMFYVLVRFFALVPPKNPQEARDKVKQYMDKSQRDSDSANMLVVVNGKAVILRHKTRTFTTSARIVNARRGALFERGLYGEQMRKAATALKVRSTGSVGYLKSVVAKGIKKFNGHFTQFGKPKRVKIEGSAKSVIERYGGNRALIEITKEYGINNSSNVATTNKSSAMARPARKSGNMLATCSMVIGIGNGGPLAKLPGSEARADEAYREAMARALNDEYNEMLSHLSDVMDSTANDAALVSSGGKAS